MAHGELACMGSPVLAFPPCYPLLLSPLFRLHNTPFLEISIVHFLLGIAFLCGIYRWARPTGAGRHRLDRSPQQRHVFAVDPLPRTDERDGVHGRHGLALGKPPALARPQGRRAFLLWLAAAAVLTVGVCLIRFVGVALAAGGSCALVAGACEAGSLPIGQTRRLARANKSSAADGMLGCARRGMLIGAAAAASVGGAMWQGHLAAQSLGGETYLDRLEAGGGAEILNDYGPWFSLVVSEIGRDTVPFLFKSYGYIGWWWDVNMLVYVPWFGLLLYGYVRWIRRNDDPLAWTLPFYLAVLTHYHSETGGRWWLPMTPAFFLCLWMALEGWRQRRRFIRAVWLAHVLAALSYWLWADLPRTRRLDQSWPAVRCLADQITVDRDRVMVDDKVSDLGQLFELVLDRHVHEGASNASIPASTQWLITKAGQPPPPGFVSRSRCGDCELLQRK